MPRHGHNANAVEEDLFVSTVDELLTPLLTIKLNLLKAGCSQVVTKIAMLAYPPNLTVLY